MPFIALIAALGLAAVHLFAGKLTFLKGKPRNVWLSIAGGLSVAFVFLHLLPELAARQDGIQESPIGAGLNFLKHHVYLLALAGMTTFYGLERVAKTARPQQAPPKAGGHAGVPVFWAHMASFAVYNLLIGYLLINEAHSLQNLAVFFLAMALHFLVMDFSFREHYQDIYHDRGRWLLAAAVVVGWGFGAFIDVPEAAMSVAIAFVAGGIVLNVLKEELPEERQSRFWPFLLGATLYSAVLLTKA